MFPLLNQRPFIHSSCVALLILEVLNGAMLSRELMYRITGRNFTGKHIESRSSESEGRITLLNCVQLVFVAHT